ncbi:MAG: NAD(+) synthase [Deltaproteobacteria bacterium]|nr:NAD(+) synthase [Deltaproteobacteria bacterium]
MGAQAEFSIDILKLDPSRETERICAWLRTSVGERLRRRGAVVALSGGVDSSVVGALCTRALGKNRVFGLLMPEGESSDDTRRLSREVALHLGIESSEVEISPLLEAAGCYQKRDDAVRRVVPSYGPGWTCKIVLPGVLASDRLPIFSVVAISPEGQETRVRLTLEAYLGIVASTNFKQRCRKMLEYYHADRLQYAVTGTPNRLEYDLGFFVKNGDGAADVKPIAHLYKSQVYQLAEYLGVPDEVRRRPPTTDTYSAPQSQDEFYFALPHREMDLCLYARNNGVQADQVAPVVGLTPEQVERVYRDIDGKREASRYLHTPALVLEGSAER